MEEKILAKLKADMKLYNFKTSDLKGVLAIRKERGRETTAKNAPEIKN